MNLNYKEKEPRRYVYSLGDDSIRQGHDIRERLVAMQDVVTRPVAATTVLQGRTVSELIRPVEQLSTFHPIPDDVKSVTGSGVLIF
jgi:hypothetical protein